MKTAKKSAAMLLAITILVAFMPIAGGSGFAMGASKPAKVKGIRGTLTNQMVDIKWNKARGAKKYQIYMKAGKGKWKLKKTVKASTRKLKVNGLKWKKTYYFKVRAVNGKKKGKFSIMLRAKVKSKKTVANFISNADCKQLAQEMLDDCNSQDTVMQSCEVIVSGNVITYKLHSTATYDPYLTADSLKSVFGTSAKKKEMSNEIKGVQNKIGIVGLKYTFNFYKSDGSFIYGISYKKL